ncbi:MAG: hypothetical protein QNJ94_16045 [Alphaproteobacteria bacterium]|nr:hypothetical protein [Alphaproteobacteria bacterium]
MLSHAKQLLLVTALFALAAPAQAGMFGDLPDVIICSVGKLKAAVYIDEVREDGTAFYKPLGNRPVQLEVGPDRVVRKENLPSCNDVTLDELRKQGRAFDLVK